MPWGRGRGMSEPLAAGGCAVCGCRRPGDGVPLGIEAVVAGRVVAWLCGGCERLPGRAWDFVGAVQHAHPGAELVRTIVAPAGFARAPLVVSADPAPGCRTPRTGEAAALLRRLLAERYTRLAAEDAATPPQAESEPEPQSP